MKFYDLLQLDPGTIRKMMAKTDSPAEKRRLRMASFTRSLLIVIFSILFISLMTGLFGSENSSMAVSIFCILLAVRFVGYGYNIKDSLINMAVVFLIMLIVPEMGLTAGPWLNWLVYIIFLFVILVITTQNPIMGNGGLYTFSFVFLCQNPVHGESLINRGWMTLVGFILCAIILWRNHKNQDKDVSFLNIIKNMSIYDKKMQWQLRLAIGVGLVIAIFQDLGTEKFMWIGFACGSLLSDYNVDNNIHEKYVDRLVGAVIGSFAFYVLYMIIPAKFYPFFGPIGGLCLGLCTEYRYKTMLNCFGALMTSVAMYGLQQAVFIRIGNTLVGILCALLFYYLFDRFILKGLLKKSQDPIAQSYQS